MKIPDRLPPSIVGLIVIVAFALGVAAGYTLRINQERVSGANVVIADMEAAKQINAEKAVEKAYVEQVKKEIEQSTFDECLTAPLPFDFSVQPKEHD